MRGHTRETLVTTIAGGSTHIRFRLHYNRVLPSPTAIAGSSRPARPGASWVRRAAARPLPNRAQSRKPISRASARSKEQ